VPGWSMRSGHRGGCEMDVEKDFVPAAVAGRGRETVEEVRCVGEL